MQPPFLSSLVLLFITFGVFTAPAANAVNDPEPRPDAVASLLLRNPITIEIGHLTFSLSYVNGQMVIQGPLTRPSRERESFNAAGISQRWRCEQGSELTNLERTLRELGMTDGVRLCLSPSTSAPYVDMHNYHSRRSGHTFIAISNRNSVSLNMMVLFTFMERPVEVRLRFSIPNARNSVHWLWGVAHLNAICSEESQDICLLDPLGAPVVAVVNRIFAQLRNSNGFALEAIQNSQRGNLVTLDPSLFGLGDNRLNQGFLSDDYSSINAPAFSADAGAIAGDIGMSSFIGGGANYHYSFPGTKGWEQPYHHIRADLRNQLNIIGTIAIYSLVTVCILASLVVVAHEDHHDYHRRYR